jgi:hypothetical protein
MLSLLSLVFSLGGAGRASLESFVLGFTAPALPSTDTLRSFNALPSAAASLLLPFPSPSLPGAFPSSPVALLLFASSF